MRKNSTRTVVGDLDAAANLRLRPRELSAAQLRQVGGGSEYIGTYSHNVCSLDVVCVLAPDGDLWC